MRVVKEGKGYYLSLRGKPRKTNSPTIFKAVCTDSSAGVIPHKFNAITVPKELIGKRIKFRVIELADNKM